MGTNYFIHRNVCDHCGRGDEPLHIGKSSGGWCFALHVYPKRIWPDESDSILDLDDWERPWMEPQSVIKDEYGTVLSPAEMRSIITERKWSRRAEHDPQWYRNNYAEPGPNGLVRHSISAESGCIRHGRGTWDCIVGEFS